MDIYTLPDFIHCALLTIDTQNDFTLPNAVLEIKGTYEIGTFSIAPGVHQCVAACARMRSGKGGIAWRDKEYWL
jgi:hypothetical protein